MSRSFLNDEASCYYCQRQYATVEHLHAHLRREHPLSPDYWARLPEHQPKTSGR